MSNCVLMTDVALLVTAHPLCIACTANATQMEMNKKHNNNQKRFVSCFIRFSAFFCFVCFAYLLQRVVTWMSFFFFTSFRLWNLLLFAGGVRICVSFTLYADFKRVIKIRMRLMNKWKVAAEMTFFICEWIHWVVYLYQPFSTYVQWMWIFLVFWFDWKEWELYMVCAYALNSSAKRNESIIILRCWMRAEMNLNPKLN